MEIFNKIGDLASKTYKNASQKTGEIAKEAKIKMQMNEDKAKIKDLYEEIGKIVYQKHTNSVEINIEEDVGTYCNQIDELSKEIEKDQEEVLTLKNKRICENCYAEIDLKAKYCPHCGFEQPEEKVEDIKEEAEPIEENEVLESEIVEEDKKEE